MFVQNCHRIWLEWNWQYTSLRCLKFITSQIWPTSSWTLLQEVFCSSQHQYPSFKGTFILCCLPTWYNDNVTFKHSSQRNWATSGQDQFMENYFESQRENIFQHCEADTERWVSGWNHGDMLPCKNIDVWSAMAMIFTIFVPFCRCHWIEYVFHTSQTRGEADTPNIHDKLSRDPGLQRQMYSAIGKLYA